MFLQFTPVHGHLFVESLLKMSTRNIFTDPDLAKFYELPQRDRADHIFCLELAKEANSVLDLGCGTGELTVQLANGRCVVGLDPAAAMLEIAKQRSGGDQVIWIEADARNFQIEQRFDLICLTGHSFQFFLNEQDQLAALQQIATHLAPKGKFVFDTRNPDFPGKKTRRKEETLNRTTHSQLGEIESWNVSEYDEDTQILSFINAYRSLSTDDVFSAPSQIKYTSHDKLQQLLKAAGLSVHTWLGEWTGEPFHAQSREIIPVGSKSS